MAACDGSRGRLLWCNSAPVARGQTRGLAWTAERSVHQAHMPCATRVQTFGGRLRRFTEDSLLLISELTTKLQGPKQWGAGQGQTRRPVDQTGSPEINRHTCGQMVSTRALRPFSREDSLSNKWR